MSSNPTSDAPGQGAAPVPENAIAVVGMAAHLPGSWDMETYWRNLRNGTECITRFTDEELEAEGVDPELLRDPNYVKANGILDRMEWFDAGFFGMSPRDAAVMDPQTRHFLECVWHALEHAGHVPERFDGPIGVFGGAGAPLYFWRNVTQDPELMESVGYFLLRHTGNDKDFVATRASYEFDLTGPSVSVQTACSTSLVAIHLATQSLLSWECDMAVAGGVTIEQPHRIGYLYEEGEILSPDGHCRSFDHKAEGTVFGSGAGVVVLRRLEDAMADGDTIHAVIRGTAVNNDGSGKVSYLAPSVDGQAKAIAEALSLSGVDADSIGMVEAHGTATPVGDPIEVTALTQAFRTQTEETGFCALGSVKSNIGHLDTAAGVASFIKAVLALEHGEIPPTVHFEEPNPLLKLDTSPFYVNAEVRPWPSDGTPRRAGVSSLGVGGTNAHVILEEAPAARPTGPSRDRHLLVVSAKTKEALEDASRALVDVLDSEEETPLADVSFTLRNGRSRFGHRRALVCADAEEAVQALATREGLVDVETDAARRETAFLFAGGGAQYPNMGRELYEREEVYRTELDRCLDHLQEAEGLDVRSLLFCPEDQVEEAARELQRPSRALPALFATQYAQARLWMSWGVEPAAMIGHSMGEYTAACLAGVFSPEAGMSLVALRGRLFEKIDRGGMISVSLGEEELKPYLGEELSIAALNAPEVSVASGPVEAIDRLEARLDADGHDARRIRIDVAAHSSMLEPVLEEFGAYLETVDFAAPSLPVISNLTGEPATEEELTDPDYWVRHLRHTVRFAGGVGRLLRPDGPVLLEVGPGRTLATLARMHPDWTQDQPSLNSLPHPDEPEDAQEFQLGTLGALWAWGVDPDWAAFDGDAPRRRIPLPGYPFQREPYFVEPPAEAARTTEVAGSGAEEERIEDLGRWLHQIAWTPTPLPDDGGEAEVGTVLLLGEAGPATDDLASVLGEQAASIVRVAAGTTFAREGESSFRVRPGSKEDWSALFGELQRGDGLPGIVVHAWCLGDEAPASSPEAATDRAFFAPLFLLQALEETAPSHPVRFVSVSTGAVGLPGDAGLDPHHALLQGPMRVVPKELPSVATRLVDVGAVPADETRRRRVFRRIARETFTADEHAVVAYRGADRLVERFEDVPLPEGEAGAGLVEEGVYLLTGGLGGIGLVMARELAEQARARLVLVSRSGLPGPEERDAWLRDHPDEDKTSRAIREVQALEDLGSQVLVLKGDVTDAGRMKQVVQEARARFGPIDGVVHAAGILDDGPLLARDREQAEAVMAAKTRGTLALESALEGEELDLVVLFSSVSAVIGAPGQVDYAAANSFMDVFARSRLDAMADRVVSLAWGAWKDVGMAAELAGETRYGVGSEETAEEIEHPYFDTRVSDTAGATGFRTRFRVGRHWMVDEHKVRDGGWVLPGSGYVELIHGAAREALADAGFVMRDLVFLRPFRIGKDETRELEVRLTPEGDRWDTLVRSRAEGGEWVEHATATVGAAWTAEDPSGLDAVMERVGSPAPMEQAEHPFMDFGPRWHNIVARTTRNGEALLRHRLDADFHADLDDVGLHPALLDMATAGAQELVPGIDVSRDFMVPAGYGAMRAPARLGSEVVSHIRLGSADEGATFASFDVTVYDPDGTVLAEVRDFNMVRVDGGAIDHETAEDGPAWLRAAIAPEEGIDIFRRVLSHPTAPHVLVATRPLDVLVEEARRTKVRAKPRAARRAPERVPAPEVAQALEAHEAVAEAAAIGGAPGASDDAARVVAFVVFEAGRSATVSELRRFLRKSSDLERARVPQNFVEMVALPRDGDGELLFGDLRDPFAVVDDYVAPRTSTEEAVASIWSELLGLDRVGIHDNFLDVGGHSLVGIRVLVKIKQETGVRLEANDLTLQTLEQLAAEIDRRGGGPSGNGAAAPPAGEAGSARDEESAGTAPQESAEAGSHSAPAGDAEGDDDPDDGGGGGVLSRMKKVIGRE